MMDLDVARTYNLSIDYNGMTALRDHPQPLTYRYGSNDQYSARLLPLHCMTHLDKPWTSRPIVHQPGTISTKAVPIVSEAVVLDFSHKQMVIKPHLLQGTDRLADKVAYLDLEKLSAEGLLYMIQQLEITRDDIEAFLKILPENFDYQKVFILLRTDWTFHFNRFNSNFNNQFLEGRAALLCSPYMKSETVNWLVELGVRRIGHDLQSLEHPLYYAVGGDVHPKVEAARNLAMAKRAMADSRVFSDNFLKVDNPIMMNGIFERYYLKNLDFSQLSRSPDDGIKDSKPSVLMGHLLVVPIRALEDDQGLACEVFLQTD